MRIARSFALLCLVCASALAPAPEARAWTRTVVKSAHATVDIERDGTLEVFLRLDVDVLAGWLHELELADLGEDVELNRYQPPYFRSEEGKVRRPKVEVTEDGRIRLSFRWKDAPKRGEHRFYIRYRTKADVALVDADGAKARIVWSMPAWETGLHGVRVDMRAPTGSSVPVDPHDMPPGARYEVNPRTARTFIQWRRMHLPRITAWPLTVDVPAEALALSVDAPRRAARPDGFKPLRVPDDRSPGEWALLFLAVLLLVKRRSVEERCGRQPLLVQASWPVTLVSVGGLLAVGQWLIDPPLLCAVPMLSFALHKPSSPTWPSTRGDWHPVAFPALPKRGASIHDFLDATTPAGLVVLVAGVLGLVALDQAAAAILLLPVFAIGTRLHVAPAPSEKSGILTGFASTLGLDGSAPPMAFSWELSSDGQPRLALALPGRRKGLISVSLVVATRPVGFIRGRLVLLSVETRAQSDADDVVRRRTALEPAFRSDEGHNVRLVPWTADAVDLLRALATRTPKPAEPSRGTWLLREISEPEQRAA